MKDTNLIIGKKNTGKTKYILFNELTEAIKRNENLCIFNTRDEYFKTFNEKLNNNGYQVYTLNLNDTTKSNGYNPLMLPYKLYKSGKLDVSVSMINNLGLELFKEDNSNVDPFWENMASNYFAGLVLILFKEGKESQINLGSIQTIMNTGEKKLNDKTYLQNYLEKIAVTDNIYTLLSGTVFAPLETRGSIISVVKQKLNLYLLREQLLNLLCIDEIKLNDIKDKTAFIIEANETLDLVNIFIDQLISISKLPFTYILDNFDVLKNILNLNNLLDNASYYQNKVFISIHSEDVILEKCGKFILNKFDNIIDLNQDNKILNNYDMMEIGNDNNYPNIDMIEHDYFNLIELIDKD